MLQTIAHRDAPAGLLDQYGLVIVDECHALGAPASEAAIRKVGVQQWVGLTATPFRADGMDDIITMRATTAPPSRPSTASSLPNPPAAS